MKKNRTLHRYLLFPCGFLPVMDSKPAHKPVEPRVRTVRKSGSSARQMYDSDSDSMEVFSVQQDIHHNDSTDNEQASSEESSGLLSTEESSSEESPAPRRSQSNRHSPIRLHYGGLGWHTVNSHNSSWR